MIIHNKPIEWYIEKLKNKEYFSMGMYGDGEWIAMFKERVGRGNAENTIYTSELCDALIESLKFKSDNFIFSVPEVLKNPELSGIGEKKIDNFLKSIEVEGIEFYEKDMWDVAAREAKLAPFIQQLRKMKVCFVGNVAFEGKLDFVDQSIPLNYPNCFIQRDYVSHNILVNNNNCDVYLFAAGLPAAVFVQDVCEKKPNSFFIDIGSIFDGLIGIGTQRGWRAELYADKNKYKKWLKQNLNN